ncbi:ABC transporter substrate-binding protein [Mesorhizobium sp. NBSH29]|nr:ABC transporter substrate-binding protein [Mesorhizobium sp. NBSH29]
MSEMAFALDLQPSIVGVTGISGWYKFSPEFEALRKDIPELAPKHASIETLIAAKPDFFFAGWNYGMRVGGEVTPERLEAYGIKTLVLTESCIHVDKNRPRASMELLFGDMERLGKVFGKEQEAARLIAGWRAELADIAAKAGKNEPIRVFLYDSGEDKPFTAGKFAMPTALIEAAGGVNIMEDLETSWVSTDWETVAMRNPPFIVLLDYQDGSGPQKMIDFLTAHPAMKQTEAVKNGRYLSLRYAELTPGPANIPAIAKLAKALHPEAF